MRTEPTPPRDPRDGYDRERAAFRRARDVGEKIVALHELLSWTWFRTLSRARIEDGARMDAKYRRTARGVRLLVHLHVSAEVRRAETLRPVLLGPCARDGGPGDWWTERCRQCTGSQFTPLGVVRCACPHHAGPFLGELKTIRVGGDR